MKLYKAFQGGSSKQFKSRFYWYRIFLRVKWANGLTFPLKQLVLAVVLVSRMNKNA